MNSPIFRNESQEKQFHILSASVMFPNQTKPLTKGLSSMELFWKQSSALHLHSISQLLEPFEYLLLKTLQHACQTHYARLAFWSSSTICRHRAMMWEQSQGMYSHSLCLVLLKTEMDAWDKLLCLSKETFSANIHPCSRESPSRCSSTKWRMYMLGRSVLRNNHKRPPSGGRPRQQCGIAGSQHPVVLTLAWQPF